MTDPTNSRKLQLEPTVDATAVRPGVEATKQAIGEIGQAAQKAGEAGSQGLAKLGAAGKKAGEEAAGGLDKIPQSTDKAAKKVEADTRSMIGSIERATAAFKAGQRGSADYFEELAKQRGISGDAIKPYVDQLRAAELAQKNAAKGLGTMEVSAKQTAAALRGVPAQLTDIVTSLQGGQQPLTVFLQQGGQLRDMFGSAGAAAKALGGAVLGLVTPFTVAAAVVAGLGFAYFKGAEEGQAFNRTLILTGNQAGATGEQLARAAAGIKSFNITQGAAAEAITLLAATGKVGEANLGRFADAAIRLQQVGGPAVEDTAKAFAELGKSPLQAALKLNEATSFLTVSVYEQIKALEQQGRTVEAAKVAQEAFAAVTEQRIPLLAANVGTLEKAWQGVKNVIKGIGDDLAAIGRTDTVADLERKLINAQIRARDAGPAGFLAVLADNNLKALREQLAAAKEVEALARRSAQTEADRARALAARVEFDKLTEQSLTKQEKLALEIQRIENLGVAAGKTRVEIERQIAAAREKAAEKVSTTGVDNELAGIKAKIAAAEQYGRALAAQGIQAKEVNEGERIAAKLREDLTGKLTAAQRKTKELALGEAERLAGILKTNGAEEQRLKLVEKSAQALTKQTATVADQAAAIERQAEQQEAANAVFGQGRVAIEEMTLAELRKQAADLEATDSTDPKYLASLNAKISAQERYAKSLKDADFKRLNQGLDEWMRSATEMQRLYQDELQLTGLTRLERDKVVAARKVEVDLAKRLAEIDKSEVDEAQKDLLRIKARQAAEIESSNAVNKVVRDDWTRTSDFIEQSLIDALMNGGKNGAEYIKGIFRTMVLKPLLQPVASGISGSIGSLLGGTESGAGGFASLIGSLGSLTGSSWFSAFGTGMGLTGGQAAAAANAYNAAGMGGTATGISWGQNAAAFGPYAALIAAGMAASGSAYDKGFNQRNLPWTTAWLASGGIAPPTLKFDTNLLTKLGVNERLANIVTGASLWSSAFGRADPRTTEQGLSGTIGGGNVMAQQYADWFAKGGWFRSDKRGTNYAGLDAELDAGLDMGAKAILEGTKAWANALAMPAEQLASITTSFRVRLTGTQQENEAAIAKLLSDYGAALTTGYTEALQPFLKSGETFSQALERLAGSLVGVNGVLDVLGQTALQATAQGGQYASQLLEQFGGLQQFQGAAAAFMADFFSEAERTALLTEQLRGQLATVGVSLPATREAYRALVEAQDLTTESGRKAYAALLQLSPTFAQLVPATEALGQAADTSAAAIQKAAEQMAEAGRKVLADLADQQGGLQVDLLRAQGDVAGAAALERQRALAKLTEGLSGQDAAAAQAAYDFNDALKAQIEALNAATTAAQQAAQAEQQRAAAVAGERDGIQARIDELLGGITAVRTRELGALDATNRALQERYYALLDEQDAARAAAQAAQEAAAALAQQAQAEEQRQAAIASERFGLEGQLLQQMGDIAALRERELAALDPSNRSLLARLYALQDEQAANQTSAEAAREAAAAQQQAAAAIAGQRDNLVTRLLQAQGDTAALRERELAALDPSNRSLLERIFGIEDEKLAQQAAAAAAQEAAQAAQQAAQAAEQLRQAWQSTTDSLFDQVARIRGLDTTSPTSFAAAQSRFAITQAQARAGDQDAAKLLPQLSDALLAIAQAQLTSATDLRLLRAQTAAGLSVTAQQLAGRFGLNVPRMATGTNEVPEDMLAIVHRGEAIVPKAFNPAVGGARDDRLLAVMNGIREDQRVQFSAVVRVQAALLKLQKKWDLNGSPPVRNEGVTA